MKKILLGTLGVILPLITITSAQDVGGVTMYFCNNEEFTKSLSLMTDGGVENEICIDFYNTSSSDVNINYGFVDGSVTADEFKNKACKNEGEIELFGQYVTQDYDEILVPANGSVRQKAHVKFPAGMSGLVNGCLTYYIKDQGNDGDAGSVFKVLVRKAAFIDVLLGGNLKRNLKVAESNPVSYSYDKKNNQYNIVVSLENLGNVDEIASISGTISNKFGYVDTFSSEEKKIVSDDKSSLSVTVSLPWYKMGYDLDLVVNSKPVFTFSENMVPDDVKGEKNLNVKMSIFVFPWILLYCLAGLLLFIILVHYISKNFQLTKKS